MLQRRSLSGHYLPVILRFWVAHSDRLRKGQRSAGGKLASLRLFCCLQVYVGDGRTVELLSGNPSLVGRVFKVLVCQCRRRQGGNGKRFGSRLR